MDTPENLQTVRDRVHVLLKGCKYVTGCETKRCSCKERAVHCSEGCQCINCRNVPVHVSRNEDIHMSELDEVALEEHIYSQGLHHNDDTEELMDWVFGADIHLERSSDIESTSEED